MDQGPEKIEDGWLRNRLRRQALSILLRAALAGAVMTVVVLVL